MDMHKIEIDFDWLAQHRTSWSGKHQEVIEKLFFNQSANAVVYRLREKIGLNPVTGALCGKKVDVSKLSAMADEELRKKFGFPPYFLPHIICFIRTGKIPFEVSETNISNIKIVLNQYRNIADDGDLMVFYDFGGDLQSPKLYEQIYQLGDTTLRIDAPRSKVVMEQGIHATAKESDTMTKLMKQMVKALRQNRESIVGLGELEGESLLLNIFICKALINGIDEPQEIRRFISEEFDKEENLLLPRLSGLKEFDQLEGFVKRVGRIKDEYFRREE